MASGTAHDHAKSSEETNQMKAALALVGTLAISTAMMAATIPSGWKVVADRPKACQDAVPPDWTLDSTFKGFAQSADKKSTSAVNSVKQSMQELKQNAEMAIPVNTVIEDSPKRLWYTYKNTLGGAPDSVNWYVAVPGNPGITCNAQITFQDPAMDTTAKQILDSLGPVK
jgi:hypothetical protein